MKRRYFPVVSGLALSLALTGCGAGAQNQPAAESQTKQEQQTSAEQSQETEASQEGEQTQVEYMTMERLEELKKAGEVDYILSEEGYVTWLTGNYFDGVIEGEAGVLAALESMRNVLGMDEETKFLKGTAIQDDNGYTYYTVRQFSGGNTVMFSIAKIITDSDGNAVALSSSIEPGVGAAMDAIIEPEDAVKIVQEHLAETEPETEYRFYPETVGKAVVSFDSDGESGYSTAYIVYTNNPDSSIERADMRYLAHYVGGDGTYLYSIPIFSIEDEYAQAGSSAEAFFEGKEETTYTGEVTLYDGSKEQVTVPVLYDEKAGVYYLADAQRKIAVMEGYAFSVDEKEKMVSTPDNTGWDNTDLLTYSNYQKVYDFFADMGCRSTDGLGTPIAIISDFRDENGEQEDNASYNGKVRGWHTFGSSPLNHYGECVDALAHEYTHGFTYASFTDILYEGENGAINEAFSDILGNVVEQLSGSTEDTQWLLAENGGRAIRSMSEPNLYGQPAFVGDAFYAPLDGEATPFNDNGGVHINNSLLAGVAVDLEAAGMTLEDQLRLWITAACAMTPETGFKELLPIMNYAADISGMGQWKEAIGESFASRGLAGNLADVIWKEAEGNGILQFSVEDSERYLVARALMLDPETVQPMQNWYSWPDGSNEVKFQYPEGDYLAALQVVDIENIGEFLRYVYTAEGWQILDENTSPEVISIRKGAPVELEPMTWQ